ncbi:uncharacterized protein LOC117220354 [Megalopta genalis]|uniref:uncharacterized protein LOC117220354 n=1 Tax=Megalopta genalis TaxID=115081 RepID=UPI003FD0C9FC
MAYMILTIGVTCPSTCTSSEAPVCEDLAQHPPGRDSSKRRASSRVCTTNNIWSFEPDTVWKGPHSTVTLLEDLAVDLYIHAAAVCENWAHHTPGRDRSKRQSSSGSTLRAQDHSRLQQEPRNVSFHRRGNSIQDVIVYWDSGRTSSRQDAAGILRDDLRKPRALHIMETVKSCVSERRTLKARLTMFKKFLESEGATADVIAFEKRVRTSEGLYETFSRIQTQIECAVMDTPHEEAQFAERESFETNYYTIMSKAETLLLRARGNSVTATNTQHSATPSLSDTFPAVRLPTIKLPTFKGDCEQWIRFRDTFTSLVHDSDRLNDIDRFNYLTSALSGSAARVIESYSVSASNYKLAWERLRERYDNPRLLVNHHLNSLLDLEQLKRPCSKGLSEFADTAINNIRALESLLTPEQFRDALISKCLAKKLDPVSLDEWDKRSMHSSESPTLKEFATFLEQRAQYLERRESNQSVMGNVGSDRPKNTPRRQGGFKPFVPATHVANQTEKCRLCDGIHVISHCPEFLAMSVEQRHGAVRSSHLCFNCLAPNHGARACTRSNCRRCGNKHHTLLHKEAASAAPESSPQEELPGSFNAHVLQSHAANVLTECTVLSTASVLIGDSKGKYHECRALLDVGSQANFVTTAFCERIGLPRRAIDATVGSLGLTKNPIRSSAQLAMKSRIGNFKSALTCLVMDTITEELPNVALNKIRITTPPGILPADPHFQTTGPVDLLIGAGLFWDLLCIGRVRVGVGNLMWQKTLLGWVLGGGLPGSTPRHRAMSCHTATNSDLEIGLSRFWEVEEVGNAEVNGKDHDPCEQHFVENTRRDEQGRFVVAIPFNDRIHELGESRPQAERRLLNPERKFRKQPDLQEQYKEFLREYENLGHMSRLDPKDIGGVSGSYYLPHHAVMKGNSTTTKLRVVFDGSAKTSSGVSLNDTQRVGPPTQDELFDILLRFRKHAIVVSADVAKMYRQVAVRGKDRSYQRILWRFSEHDAIGEYSLNTVTYGTASASYLATRVLQQIGKDCAHSLPDVSEVILSDFYVDDLLTGCETYEQALGLRNELSSVLAKAGFPLRKWASNDLRLADRNVDNAQNLTFKSLDREPKILGLLWSTSDDKLGYDVGHGKPSRITKRHVLAEIAQIFDPLGLIGPVIVKAKMFIQLLWQIRLGWDESLPQSLHAQWQRFRGEIPAVSELRIPRRVLQVQRDVSIHGFSDASERAYGAAVYLRSRASDGSWVVFLLCAKSRVAPLKTVSLPRLELCGAVLLARLIARVRKALKIKALRIHCWTDSQVVLAWLKDSPSRWKTFIANRVAEVQTLTEITSWGHVISSDNPADLLSRGASPTVLKGNKLWWHGPDWLISEERDWPHREVKISTVEVPEARSVQLVKLTTSVSPEHPVLKLIEGQSCYSKLLRILAYVLRFCSKSQRTDKASRSKCQGSPSVTELSSAERIVIRVTQNHHHSVEMRQLGARQPLDRTSSLLSLNPFVDELGIIRVGGRLRNAPIAFSRKHPILIPSSSPLAVLIIRREHLRLLHAGCQQTLASLHANYWIPSGGRITRKVLRSCMICFRTKPGAAQPQMGNLPADRVTPARAFSTCGVDYAGPFLVVDSGRSRTSRKAYLCLFVCFVTKAVHLELAVDLTTDSFLNCLRRFTARRGMCRVIHSDNGTNFIGARNELRDLGHLLASPAHNDKVKGALAQNKIQWQLIPPRAPHFGGLWERAVRSVKTHLRRVIGEQRLTFEEMCTVLTQVEACLNSRPLHPLSSDPSDLNPLTPGHFLVGEALTALPHVHLLDTPRNRLNRFQLLQQMVQHFWKRWHQEYLHGLQQRRKWRQGCAVVPKVGALVLIKEDNLPPMKWALGRIWELHPGQDGVCRVVTLRTAQGTLKRPTTRICLLPLEDELTGSSTVEPPPIL